MQRAAVSQNSKSTLLSMILNISTPCISSKGVLASLGNQLVWSKFGPRNAPGRPILLDSRFNVPCAATKQGEQGKKGIALEQGGRLRNAKNQDQLGQGVIRETQEVGPSISEGATRRASNCGPRLWRVKGI